MAVSHANQSDDAAPRRINRRRMLKGLIWSAIASPFVAGAYARWIEPFWVTFTSVPMPIGGLGAGLKGFRIAQFTDPHVGLTPINYLRGVVDSVNRAAPDAVVVTGDVVHHDVTAVLKAASLLARFDAPVYVSFGNHDYVDGASNGWAGDTPLADELAAAIHRAGCVVLRNESATIERDGATLQLIGLEDLWTARYDAPAATRTVKPGVPAIALSHNPDTALDLDALDAPPAWILSGHTHGGQVRMPFYGAPILPIQHWQFDQGSFQLTHSRLYVCRGVGYLRKVRFNCRPQVTTFELTDAGQDPPSPATSTPA